MDREWAYLPQVLRKADWVKLDISEKPCDCCGKYAEEHSWGLLDSTGQTILFCSETAPIRAMPVNSNIVGLNMGKLYV
jgi:hypothetical protein